MTAALHFPPASPSRRRTAAMWVPLVAVNFCLAAAVAMAPRWAPAALALALAIPFLAALMRTPQLGVLVLVAVAPFNGLLLIVPHPVVVNGWKEALVIATLLATFMAPNR